MKLQELRVAWKKTYNERFPDDIVFFKDISAVKLPAAPHKIAILPSHNTFLVYNTKTHATYNKITHIVLNKRDHALLQRDQKFIATAKKI